MARTLDLYQLLSQPESYRNEEWERAFLESFIDAQVAVVSEQPKNGPDGWPYIFVQTGSGGKEPVEKVMRWLSERGIGLVVNPHKMAPDYIFTYGMIWNFRETGQFLTSPAATSSGDAVYSQSDKWLFGAPAESYLPTYVRRILREFFAAQQISEPKILVATSPDYKQTDLIFSLEALGNPPAHEHKKIAEAFGWFLPSHYSIVLASEERMPVFTII